MPTTRQDAPVPRSLADDLRARTDEELAALLERRPDLVTPVPVDIGQLATRATTQTSVSRALDRLDLWQLQTVEVLAALPEATTAEAVSRWLGQDASAPLAALREMALAWGTAEEPRLVRTARQIVGASHGLGPALRDALPGYGPRRSAQLLADLGLPAQPDPVQAADDVARHLESSGVLDAMLQEAPAPARELLDRLTWGSPTGRVNDAMRTVSIAAAGTPVEWLLARALLVAIDATTVAVPREVGVHLRGGRVHSRAEPEPSPLETVTREVTSVDRTAGGAAFEHLRHVEDLLEAWSVDGPPILRAGGLGVRELKRAAQRLDLEEWHAAFVIETAYVAGLVGASGEVEDAWWPTPAYDSWLAEELPTRWTTLADAWLGTTRVSGLIGNRDEREKVLSALGPDLDRPSAMIVRSGVLAELAALPPGTAATVASLQERLAWRRPRRTGPWQDDLVAWTLREGELLGVLGRGAVSTPGRALLGGDRDGAAAALGDLLPAPLDHVLLQADLTAVAPGPLETALAQELALMADIESKGGATVYRFTESSVRRALDAGRSASDLHALLAQRSRTPVPQPLAYLIDDVARRHGRIRVGTASAYIRGDDESLLAQIVADKRSAPLRLRRLAPSIVAAQAPVDAVLAKLRDMGYAPMPETPEGDVVIRRPDAHRTPARQRPPRITGEPPTPSRTLLTAAVRAIRAGDRASTTERRSATLSAPAGSVPRSPTGETLAVLQEAVADGRPLWIGYVNNDGQATQRVVEPVKVEGGYLTAFDHLRDEVRTFAVHRITGVAHIES